MYMYYHKRTEVYHKRTEARGAIRFYCHMFLIDAPLLISDGKYCSVHVFESGQKESDPGSNKVLGYRGTL